MKQDADLGKLLKYPESLVIVGGGGVVGPAKNHWPNYSLEKLYIKLENLYKKKLHLVSNKSIQNIF